jgi:hypothetical protein
MFLIISCSVLLRTTKVSNKSCGEVETHILCWIAFFKSRHLWNNVEKCYTTGQATWQYGAHVLHAGYLRLPTHTHTHTHTGCVNLFHHNRGCTIVPQCYVICTLPVSFTPTIITFMTITYIFCCLLSELFHHFIYPTNSLSWSTYKFFNKSKLTAFNNTTL